MEMLLREVIPMPKHLHKSIRSPLLCPSESNLREDKNVARGCTNAFTGKSFWWISSALLSLEWGLVLVLLCCLSCH
ncbi:unnamed protein product, partial [Bubo scandiacus]